MTGLAAKTYVRLYTSHVKGSRAGRAHPGRVRRRQHRRELGAAAEPVAHTNAVVEEAERRRRARQASVELPHQARGVAGSLERGLEVGGEGGRARNQHHALRALVQTVRGDQLLTQTQRLANDTSPTSSGAQGQPSYLL